jgi:endonuclease/exonuclease/phosphatase family metal-dependent hydrolase
LPYKKLDVTGGLVTFSKYPIISTRFVPFPRLVNASFIEIFARKGFLETVLELPDGLLRIVNLHLSQDSILGFHSLVRRRQLGFALKNLSEEYKELPTVFMGDFNENDMTEKKSFTSILEAAKIWDPGALFAAANLTTYRPENEYANFGPYRFNTKKLAKRLDYILLKNAGNYALTPIIYNPVHFEEPLSDHDPVILTFQLQED